MVTLGDKLREARKEKEITLEEAAKATKIKLSFLQAIEKGEYHKLPSGAYVFGFVNNYVEFLGLPKKETIAMFRREFAGENLDKVLPEGMQKGGNLIFRGVRVSQTVFVVITLFLLFLGYILFQYRYAFIEPPLTVTSPQDGKIAQAQVIVKGFTDPSVEIFVNNQPVPVDSQGGFEKSLTLAPGEAVVEIRAKHRLGKEAEIERRINIQ